MPWRAPKRERDGLLPDRVVSSLVEELTPTHRRFLSALGRGLGPLEAARGAGWRGEEADRIADVYMRTHPIVSPLASHILRLRDLAMLGDEASADAGAALVH